MHRLSTVTVLVSVAVTLVLASPWPAQADQPPGATSGAQCAPRTGVCTIAVTKKPAPGRSTRHHGVNAAPASSTKALPPQPSCRWERENPQPPASDSVWAGRTTGAFYDYICTGVNDFVAEVWRAAGPPATAPAGVTPAQEAQEALAKLKIPKPVVGRSPSASNSDDGVPYTWVNLWTWFWTSPATWKARSATATLGAASATVTVTPQELGFTPGDGAPAVSCPGPGRPWRAADGTAAPSDGGCGYRYLKVSDDVRPQLWVRWSVTWTGSGGTKGQLPDITSRSMSPRTKVEQIQEVNL